MDVEVGPAEAVRHAAASGSPGAVLPSPGGPWTVAVAPLVLPVPAASASRSGQIGANTAPH